MPESYEDQRERLKRAVAFNRRRLGLSVEEEPDELGQLKYRVERLETIVQKLRTDKRKA